MINKHNDFKINEWHKLCTPCVSGVICLWHRRLTAAGGLCTATSPDHLSIRDLWLSRGSLSLDATTATLYYLSALIMRLNLLFIRVQRGSEGYLLVEGTFIKVLLQKKKQIKSESGAIIGSL